MDVKQVLEELLAIPEQKSPIASVYLDTRRIDQHERHEVQVFVHDHVREALKTAGRERFDELKATLEPIEQYVAAVLRQRVDQWATGLAIFSSAPAKLLRIVATRTPFRPMEFFLEPRPRLLPLVRTAAVMPPILLAAVDAEGGYLFEASSGVVDVEASVDRPFPGRHSMGGWRQRRIQQHLHKLIDKNLEAAAQPLVRMADMIKDGLIVLAGQNPLLVAFEHQLPERTLERVIARVPFHPFLEGGELRQDLLREAWQQAQEVLRQRTLAARDIALAEAAREGIGVEGAKRVLLALNEGRVHKLLLDPTWGAKGWECRRCTAIGEAAATACPYCGGELAIVDLPEAIVRKAWRDDVQLAFLPRDERLPAGIGMAALLRPRRTNAWAPTLGEISLPEQ